MQATIKDIYSGNQCHVINLHIKVILFTVKFSCALNYIDDFLLKEFRTPTHHLLCAA
jgi:hypothetical protein